MYLVPLIIKATDKASKVVKNAGSRINQELAKINKGARHTKGNVDILTHSLENFKRMIGTLAFYYGFQALAKELVNFDKAIRRTSAVLRASQPQFQKLNALAIQLGSTTVFTASQVAEGMTFMAMAGFEVNEVLSVMPAVVDLAAAAQLDLGRAADIASNILTAFGKDVGMLNKVMDTLVATAVSSNTSVEQLSEALKYSAPVANTLGESVEETSGAIALLGNAGIQASYAGTSLRRIYSELINPTGQAEDIIKRLGITVTDAAGNFLGFTDILRQFEKAGATAGEVMAAFGMRGGPAFAALLNQGSYALEDMIEKIDGMGGIAEDVAEEQLAGLYGAIIEVTNAIKGLVLSFGEGGANEGLVNLFRDIADVVNYINQLDDASKSATVEAGKLSLKLAGLGMAASVATRHPYTAMLIFLIGKLIKAGVEADIVSARLQNLYDVVGRFRNLESSIQPVEINLDSMTVNSWQSQIQEFQTTMSSLRENQVKLQEKLDVAENTLRNHPVNVNKDLSDEYLENLVLPFSEINVMTGQLKSLAEEILQYRRELLLTELAMEDVANVQEKFNSSETLRRYRELYVVTQDVNEELSKVEGTQNKVAESQRKFGEIEFLQPQLQELRNLRTEYSSFALELKNMETIEVREMERANELLALMADKRQKINELVVLLEEFRNIEINRGDLSADIFYRAAEGAATLADSMRELQSINLERLGFKSDEDFAAVSESIDAIPTLLKLKIDYSDYTPSKIIELIKDPQALRQLEDMDIEFNMVNSDEVMRIIGQLQHINTLVTFGLDKDSANAMREAIKVNMQSGVDKVNFNEALEAADMDISNFTAGSLKRFVDQYERIKDSPSFDEDRLRHRIRVEHLANEDNYPDESALSAINRESDLVALQELGVPAEDAGKLADELERVREQTERLSPLAHTAVNAFANFAASSIMQMQSVEDAFKQMVQTLLYEAIKLMVLEAIFTAIGLPGGGKAAASIIPNKYAGGNVDIPQYATGGRHPADRTLAYLAEDEYVIRQSSAKKIGKNTLDKMNATGEVGESGIGNYNVSINVDAKQDSEDVAIAITSELNKIAESHIAPMIKRLRRERKI